MVFSSMIFLWVFFPVTLALYYGITRMGKQEMGNLLLLFMSILFYGFGEPKYVVLLLVSVVINYVGGLAVDGMSGGGRRTALAVTVVLNLGLLGYFKYYMFAAETVNRLAGSRLLPLRQIALPIGISFYTFQALSYVIDLYRGNCRVQKSFYKLLLYISFFPQLVAGPIVRYRDIAGQIDERHVDGSKFSDGLARFVAGLAKKVILANTFASAADRVFALDGASRGTLAAWYGLVLYGMQIYFDFSGYSDMAIGMGKMFGFDFLENFNMPFISQSIREFWRRWHISLSTWFKEYLYIPLGGSRKGTVRTCVNLFLVFLVTGFWHGAGWNYILWGMFHGIFVVAERLLANRWPKGAGNAMLGHVYCLLVVTASWALFRTETPAAALDYIGSMFRLSAGAVGFGELFGREVMALSLVGAALCVAIPQRVQERIRDGALFRGLAMPCMLLVCIVLLAADSYNPFIYFRF